MAAPYFFLKDAFVCNHCRQTCGGTCSVEIEEILNGTRENDGLYPRKQLIGCLGDYCDKPCGFRKAGTDLTYEQLVTLVKYLGNRLNEELFKNKEKLD